MKPEPKVEQRSDQPYLGLRTQVPLRKMKKVIGPMLVEVFAFVKEHGLEQNGAPFVRYHVIDMAGLMDIEMGVPLAEPAPASALIGSQRIQAGVLPAGRYAALVFTGANHGYKGNAALLDWGAKHGLAWDRWDVEAGDAFRSRYETYLTDPDVEPDPRKWQIEVAIRLKD